MDMHPEFADWYRTASVTPPQELLNSRWAAVEEVAAGLTGASIVPLLRLFAVRTDVEPSVPGFLESALRKHDATYSSRGGGEELRVLAAAVLRQSIEADHAIAVAAALGMLCASFGSRAEKLSASEHLSAAESYLARKAITVREIKWPTLLKAPPSLTKERYDEIAPAPHFEPAQIASARTLLFNAMVEASAKPNDNLPAINSAFVLLTQATQTVREEINLLWWLQTKFSRDLKKPFAELSRPAATLILPLELADLTVYLPGPDAILGIIFSGLQRANTQETKESLVNIVNSAPRAWREKRNNTLGIHELNDLCPVLFALSISLETDGDSDWLPVYRKKCNVDLNEDLPLQEVAMQVYREKLFARAIAEAKK